MGSDRVEQAFTSTWARLIDYSAWQLPPGDATTAAILPKNRRTGAIVINGGLKKALLQSSPWVLIPFLTMAASWMRRKARVTRLHREQRALSLIIVAVIGAFAFYGFRHDGWCFNQRYLLELMPLLSIALAMSLKERRLRWVQLLAGGAFGIAIGALVGSLEPLNETRQLLLLYVPIAMSGVLAISWVIKRETGVREALFGIALGMCIGWAFIVHLCDDLPASRDLRHRNFTILKTFRAAVPSDRPAAIFAYWGSKDSFGPLMLERDIVIVDPWIDDGRDARVLLDQLLASGRAAYMILPMPRDIGDALTVNRHPARVQDVPWLIEIR
jgi:hypothetical protein